MVCPIVRFGGGATTGKNADNSYHFRAGFGFYDLDGVSRFKGDLHCKIPQPEFAVQGELRAANKGQELRVGAGLHFTIYSNGHAGSRISS